METQNKTILGWVNTNYRLVEIGAIAAAALAGLINTSVQVKINMVETKASNAATIQRADSRIENFVLSTQKDLQAFQMETSKRLQAVERQLDNVTLDLETQRREVREDMQLLREGRSLRPSR